MQTVIKEPTLSATVKVAMPSPLRVMLRQIYGDDVRANTLIVELEQTWPSWEVVYWLGKQLTGRDFSCESFGLLIPAGLSTQNLPSWAEFNESVGDFTLYNVYDRQEFAAAVEAAFARPSPQGAFR